MYDKKRFICHLYSAIARRYDLTNRVISLGRAHHWRKLAARNLPRRGWLVDLGSGTGDMTLAYFHKSSPDVRIALVDFNRQMLERAKQKLAGKAWRDRIHFVIGDIERLPFKTSCFTGEMSAFVLRNLPAIGSAAKEAHRVLQSGGRAVFLDFIRPPAGWLRRLFDLYFQKLMPRLAAIVNPGHNWAYRYLARSVGEFPRPDQIIQELGRAGFTDYHIRSLHGGIATIFEVSRPAAVS